MEENLKKLLLEFNTITKKDWILGTSKAPNSIGLTFENKINKKYDTNIFPDYHNIEIKCTQRFSDYPITLFSKSLEGPQPFETNYYLIFIIKMKN